MGTIFAATWEELVWDWCQLRGKHPNLEWGVVLLTAFEHLDPAILDVSCVSRLLGMC